MASVNKVILIGNLGRDPEIRYTPNGEAVCNITLATTESWKERGSSDHNVRKERTDWHRVSFFGKLAEVVVMHLKKGSSIYVEGSLRSRKYKDRDGTEKSLTEVRGESMQMLSSRPAPVATTAATAPAAPDNTNAQHGKEPASSHGPAHDAYALAQHRLHSTAEVAETTSNTAPDMPDHALPDISGTADSFMPYTGMEMPDDIPL